MTGSPSDDPLPSPIRFLLGRAFTPWILGTLAAVMAVITIFEASTVNPPVPFPYYHSWWFFALLALFCLNILGVFLRRELLRIDRWPNQFVHQGLVLLLLGGLISHVYGEEGFLEIPEGRTADFYWGRTPDVVLEQGSLRRRVDLGDLEEARGDVVEAPGGRRFRVMEVIPHAAPAEEGEGFVPSEGGGDPAIRLREDEGEDDVWLAAERPLVEVGDTKLALTYRRPLGFRLTLLQAGQTTWPASSIPRAYYSWVRITDPDRGFTREFAVETNDPLEYRGYRFYQSSMGAGRQGSRSSGFQVTRDPGVIWVTIGISMTGLGLLVLYSLRFVRDPLLARRRRRAQERAALAGETTPEDAGGDDSVAVGDGGAR